MGNQEMSFSIDSCIWLLEQFFIEANDFHIVGGVKNRRVARAHPSYKITLTGSVVPGIGLSTIVPILTVIPAPAAHLGCHFFFF